MRAHSIPLRATSFAARRTSPGLLALAFAGALGCSAPVVNVNVAVVTSACTLALSVDPQRDPMAGVQTLTFTLAGDGLSPSTITTPYVAGDGTASIPNVPLGKNRRLTAEALVAGGLVRARADSGPFDVTGSGDVQVSLFLRVVDAFVFAESSDGSTCTHLNTPRAGHQMTLLPDGRVLISGGFNIDINGAVHYLTQAELYDPTDGSFSNVAVQASYGRAGHAALPVTINGAQQVLLLGGEGAPDGQVGPVGPFELYNPATGTFSSVPLPNGEPARERAAAVVDVKTGNPVIAGGANGPDIAGGSSTAFDTLSYFNSSSGVIVPVAEPLPTAFSDAVAVSRQNKVTGVVNGGVVLVGGLDASGNATGQMSGVVFNELTQQYTADSTFEQSGFRALPTPRVKHAAVVSPADDTILVIGGQTVANSNYNSTTNAITIVDPSSLSTTNATAVLSQSRADGCAVLLASSDILYVGGAWGDGTNGVNSTRSVDLISHSAGSTSVRALEGPAQGNDWALQAARHQAACLQLADGTVLVTGGLQYQSESGLPTTLGSAEIYTPPAAQ